MRPDPHTVAPALTPAVAAMLVAKAKAQLLREEIDAIKVRLLTERAYTSQYDGKAITEPKSDWTMGDADSAHYHARLAEETLQAGHVVPEDCCPALMAEHDLTKTEWALIEAAEAFFPGVTNGRLLCGVENADGTRKGGLETRQEFIDLIAGLCVNYPGTGLAA